MADRGDGLKLYVYVGNNPVNYSDPGEYNAEDYENKENPYKNNQKPPNEPPKQLVLPPGNEITDPSRMLPAPRDLITDLGRMLPEGLGKNSNPIKPYEVTNYADFAKRSVKGDGLEGHEIWQFANMNENGYAKQRLVGEVSRKNPVIALPHDVHVEVNNAQGSINARAQTPLENINANKDILIDNPKIPNANVNELHNKAITHFNNMSGGEK